MLELYYDFHIHSCLSPCGDDDMTPNNIVGMAVLAGYDVIAIADHNSCGNCRAVMQAAAQTNLLVIPAMELTTSEEVHVLCLFPDLDAADLFSQYVYRRLPDIQNQPNIFGKQLYLNAQDEVVREEGKLLISATDIGIYQVCDLMKQYGGVAIPSHVDRNSFSLISNLGFYDADMGFTALELTARCDSEKFKQVNNIPIPHIVNSDAHALNMIPDPVNRICVGSFCVRGVIDAVENGVF